MKKEELVYLALGSNLGDRNANLKQATLNLKKGLTILRVSHVYETPPWGVTDQPAFYNQVVEVKTSLSPQELLKLIKQIETEMGRVPGIRFGPRLIDIDILLYGCLDFNSSDLIIPHPRLTERAFVLVPLAELAPDLILPNSEKKISAVLKTVDTTGIKQLELN